MAEKVRARMLSPRWGRPVRPTEERAEEIARNVMAPLMALLYEHRITPVEWLALTDAVVQGWCSLSTEMECSVVLKVVSRNLANGVGAHLLCPIGVEALDCPCGGSDPDCPLCTVCVSGEVT